MKDLFKYYDTNIFFESSFNINNYTYNKGLNENKRK